MMIPWRAPEEQLVILHISNTENQFELTIKSTHTTAICPYCHQISTRIHSHYKRQIQDLPFGEQSIHLNFIVCKWFCDDIQCSARIFTERFTWLKPYSRRTERLTSILRKLAFSTSCPNAEKVARAFHISVSHDTLLTIIRNTDIPINQPKAIGLDDFALRKGQIYGTLICDAITHHPLAILPDRTVETVRDWLKQFPTIEKVSRDGSYSYKDAISQANSKIDQILDRWHVMKNAKDALNEWLKTVLPSTIKWLQPSPDKEIQEVAPIEIDEEKWLMIQAIQQDQQRGIKIAHLARKYHLSRATIYKYLQVKEPPLKKLPRFKPSQLLLRPYHTQIKELNKLGGTMDSIYKAIRKSGFTGTYAALRIFLEDHRRRLKESRAHEPEFILTRMQVAAYVWVGHSRLSKKKQIYFTQCKKLYPFLDNIEETVQLYRTIFETRDYSALLKWMKEHLNNKKSPFHSHCRTLRKDLSALKNAFIYPFSNGLLEGQVNRLKMIKRLMYGRAKLDFLEKRVLYRE